MADLKTINYYLDDVAIADRVNVAGINAEATASAKSTLETLFTDTPNGITAIVGLTGTYLKVKFMSAGKKLGAFKSRNYVQDEVFTALEYMKTNGRTGISAAATVALTGTNTGAAAATSQYVCTLTRADASTVVVTGQATWTSSDPAKATVDSVGLVTAVATGATTITATYAGVTNTRVFTTG